MKVYVVIEKSPDGTLRFADDNTLHAYRKKAGADWECERMTRLYGEGGFHYYVAEYDIVPLEEE